MTSFVARFDMTTSFHKNFATFTKKTLKYFEKFDEMKAG
jgi:hypothetical protein